MLGFTNYKLPQKAGKNTKTQWLVIVTILTLTLVVLSALLDSYFFQRVKPFISPWQRNDIQNCVMSYSYPTYIDIDGVDTKFTRKYKLKLFRDGYQDDPQLYGRPALFIPGQAGSYGQVRSLASTTTNSYHDHPSGSGNIDFFTVDLNEELSALHGQNLLDQAEFLNAAMDRILSLYSEPRPKSVMIIGHSMGGVVARAMPMLDNYKQHSIHTIITISTPHLSAPLLLDRVTYQTYQRITRYWKHFQNTLLKDVVVVSIAGGSLDTIVHSDGVSIDSFIPISHGFTTFTTSIPNVWTGSDHMAILWCNQFIRTLAITLLEIVDDSSVQARMNIFKLHLLEGGSASLIQSQIKMTNINSIERRMVEEPSVSLLFSKEAKASIHLFSTARHLEMMTNIPQHNDNRWSLVVCKELASKDCEYVEPKVVLLPSATADILVGSTPYRLLKLSATQTKNNAYVGIIDHGGQAILDGDSRVFINIHEKSDAPVVHSISLWDIASKKAHIRVDNYQSVHEFPHITNSLFSLDVNVLSLNRSSSLFKPMMKQSINNKETKYYRQLQEGISDKIAFHQETDPNNTGLVLEFYVDTETIEIEISIDWYSTLGRIVLRYGIIMATFLWIITLIVLLSQLYTYQMNGKSIFPNFQSSLLYSLHSSVLQLVLLLLFACFVQFCLFNWFNAYPVFANMMKHVLFGSKDWMMVGLVLFVFVLTVGIAFLIWFLVSLAVYIVSLPLGLLPQRTKQHGRHYALLHLTVVVGLLAFIPSSVLFTSYCVIWLCMTASARVLAKSDLPTCQNVYNYRLSWLVFLISLLPYSVPGVIAYVKDLTIGWTQHGFTFIPEDIIKVLLVTYLVSIGKNPDHLQSKFLYPVINIMNMAILYHVLFGFFYPFPLSLL